jgi:stage II sporulation protein P
MSLTEHGAGYVQGAVEGLPPALPREELWTGEGMPTVLIIHTHPFEGYGDGKPWYDPAAGSLAVTDSPYDPEGVVALGAALSRSLREAGVTVIHLRVAVSESDSAADVYGRTEAAVRSYCSMYPDIGLVIDLRRSAEMTEAGGILRTAGELDGEACAQLRISVNGGRGEGAVERDLAAALALREALWQVSPTISRPVRVKSGSGIAGVAEGVCQLTLELGAAGNPYPEAQRLVAPLAAALGNVLDG